VVYEGDMLIVGFVSSNVSVFFSEVVLVCLTLGAYVCVKVYCSSVLIMSLNFRLVFQSFALV
jgi:hypothetical protein